MNDSFNHINSQDWLQKEAHGDERLLKLLERREQFGNKLAQTPGRVAQRLRMAAMKDDSSRIEQRQHSLGIDPVADTFSYDITGIENEMNIVAENAARNSSHDK